MSRRSAVLAAVFAVMLLGAACARAANPVAAENGLPGDSAWLGAVVSHVNYLHPPIEGYASATSVRPGGTIDFYVDVPQAGERYRVEIARLGWYGGAGGRRLTCLIGSRVDQTCTGDEPGTVQPAAVTDPTTHEVVANWGVTDQLQVPATWVTGYYVAIFQLTGGPEAGQTGFAPFIVQAPAGERSQILVVVPTNTWEAYNAWGGTDVYTSPEALKVSFNRPFQHHLLFTWEYPLVRFLERGGYDVTYVTDDDVDRDPAILLGHRLDIEAGHAEYWTHRERNAWQAARAAGVNLAFMGANTGYWQVRLEDGDRTMVSYKYSHDPDPNPAVKTRRFRSLDPPRPECELLGEEYRDNGSSSEDGRFYGYTVTRAAARDPWFAGSGLHAGSAIPGIAAFEFDSPKPGCRVPPVTVLLRFRHRHLLAEAVRYRACSGAEVFNAGSLFFSWGLDGFRGPDYAPPQWPNEPSPSPALQKVMTNAIADMLIAHPRFDASRALSVGRGGSRLRVDPGVPGAVVSAREYALEPARTGTLARVEIDHAQGLGAVTLAGAVPASAGAVLVRVAVRTGEVVDSGQYILQPTRAGGVTGPAAQLERANCYGPSARVLTPVFGGAAREPLRVAVSLPVRATVSVVRGGVRVGFTRIGRARAGRSAVARIPSGRITPGRWTIVVSGGGYRFVLGALRARDLEDYHDG